MASAAAALARGERLLIQDVSGLPGFSNGAWDKPPRQAMIVPIAQQGLEQPAGAFVLEAAAIAKASVT